MPHAMNEIGRAWDFLWVKTGSKGHKTLQSPLSQCQSESNIQFITAKIGVCRSYFFLNSNRKTSDPLKYLSPIGNLNCHSMEKHFFSQKESFNCLHMCLLAINLSNLCIENMHKLGRKCKSFTYILKFTHLKLNFKFLCAVF